MRLLSLLISVFIVSFSHAQPVKKFGALQVRGTQLCDSKGKPVVLRGMSFGWHNFWPRFYNAVQSTGCIKIGIAAWFVRLWALN